MFLKVHRYYALVEVWRSVSKILDGKSLILRIWNDWADEQDHVYFVAKKIKNPKHDAKPVSQSYPLDEMRKYVRQEEQTKNVKENKEKLCRRNSSLRKNFRKPPDTFHPRKTSRRSEDIYSQNSLPKSNLKTPLKLPVGCSPQAYSKEFICQSIEKRMKVMINQSENIKKEISKLQVKFTNSYNYN